MTRIHHLNCGTMCPRGRAWINGDGSVLADARIVCHVLLIELADRLVLVDTGFGRDDVANPRQLTRPFTALMRPRLNEADTAIAQVRAIGLDPADVRDVVLTHLDLDHAGGLPDFPNANVHLFADEYRAMRRPPLRERVRYRAGAAHWAHGPKWSPHELDGDHWLGFESIHVLPGADPEILLIPLRGHTLGHTAVAVQREGRWLLHCGDAYFHRDEVATPHSCPPALRLFQNVVQADGNLRHANQERLRELARRHGEEVELICSHDPVTLERAQRS